MVTKATNTVLNLVDPPIDEIVLVTALAPSSGGTGRDTLTAGSVLIGDGVSQVALVAPGTISFALLSNGPGVAPSFQQITMDIVSGVLPVPQGGTAKASFGVGNLLVGNGTSALIEVDTAVGNVGYPLISQGEGLSPQYANLAAAYITGTMTVPQGGTGLSTLGVGSVLIGNGTNSITLVPPGTAGLALVSQGTGVPPTFSYINLMEPSVFGVLSAANAPVQLLGVFSVGSHTFTVGTYTRFIRAEVCGGGGGGAGENTGGPFTGGGGGAGGYATTWIPVVPGEVTNITVGVGGAGGPGTSDGSGNGFNGGSSTFSASGGTVSATGGNGGHSGSNAAGGEGGVGSASIGALVQYGGYGTDGTIMGGEEFGGNGGASFFGGGVRGGRGGPVAGNAASGSGGGGGYFGSSAGSIGMDGIVILWG